MPLRLDIVTVERLAYSGEVDMVIAPGIEGELGILPHHAPLLTALKYGELRVRRGDEEDIYAIGGGFMEVLPLQVAVMAEDRPELIADQFQRLLPIEVQVQVVGYYCSDGLCYWLPPQPPMSLTRIMTCTDAELREFTERFDYFRLVMGSSDLLADELLAAHLRYAAQARGEAGRGFLVDAGRELARLLAMDLSRLDGLLRRIRP